MFPVSFLLSVELWPHKGHLLGQEAYGVVSGTSCAFSSETHSLYNHGVRVRTRVPPPAARARVRQVRRSRRFTSPRVVPRALRTTLDSVPMFIAATGVTQNPSFTPRRRSRPLPHAGSDYHSGGPGWTGSGRVPKPLQLGSATSRSPDRWAMRLHGNG
jgi:hypothetical protein